MSLLAVEVAVEKADAADVGKVGADPMSLLAVEVAVEKADAVDVGEVGDDPALASPLGIQLLLCPEQKTVAQETASHPPRWAPAQRSRPPR